MLQIAAIRRNSEDLINRLNIRGIDGKSLISEVLLLDEKNRAIRTQMEQTQAQLNQISSQIGDFYKSGNKAEGDKLKDQSSGLKDQLKELENAVESGETTLTQLLLTIPNTPQLDVPVGKSADDNVTVLEFGSKPTLDDSALPHWELAKKYNIIDFELGVKLTGAGFPVYKGQGARLQRALINFFLDEALKAGYYEIMPPHVVNSESGFGTGQLPDKEGQMYHMQIDDGGLCITRRSMREKRCCSASKRSTSFKVLPTSSARNSNTSCSPSRPNP